MQSTTALDLPQGIVTTSPSRRLSPANFSVVHPVCSPVYSKNTFPSGTSMENKSFANKYG